MELWIRSQDREEMVKVDNLYIKETTIYREINDELISGKALGHYKTKERAIKVLDEIYETLSGANIVEYLNKTNGNMNNVFPILTYEMPKE